MLSIYFIFLLNSAWRAYKKDVYFYNNSKISEKYVIQFPRETENLDNMT